MSVTIQPDAKISITQKCADCQGEGVVGFRSQCGNCGHVFSQAELAAENRAWNAGDQEHQGCGCSWSHRADRDIVCAECEGTGTQHRAVTLSELAEALAVPLARVLAQQAAQQAEV
jgi:hypothetical protein